MAFATREVKIANPGGRTMAKRMSLKQRAHFGSKRVRVAAQRALKGRKRPTAKRSHRVRTTRKRRNIGEIVVATLPAVFNPARRSKRMATKKRARRPKQNAGRRRKTYTARRKRVQSNPGRRRRVVVMQNRRKRVTHRNPGRIGTMVQAGAAVVGGAVASKLATQMVLGAKNTGVMGYAANAAATGILGYAAHLAFKDKSISTMVVAGGIAQIIVRVIQDYSLLGKYSAQLGIGDYQVSNFWTPQRLPNAYQAANPQFPGSALPVMAAPAAAGASGAAGVGSFLY